MLKVWGRRNSLNVQKVMWLIAELNIPHEHIPAGGSFGLLDTPDFLRKNPWGKIPVIEDEGVAIWESHAILRYLAATYGQSQFWPQPSERAISDAWMDWAQTSLQPVFLDGIFWAYYRTPEQQRNHALIDKSIERCAQFFKILDRHLEHKLFMNGDALSLADIPIGTMLYRYFELDIERPKVPHVEAWYRRLKERKAYQEHVMVSFSDMKGKLSY